MIPSKSRILLASAVSLLVLSACNPDDKAKSAAGPAVKEAAAATVNGIAISKNRVDMIVKQGLASGQPDSPELRKGIIDKLAMQTLIAEEAVKKGLDKSADVMDQIDLTRQFENNGDLYEGRHAASSERVTISKTGAFRSIISLVTTISFTPFSDGK